MRILNVFIAAATAIFAVAACQKENEEPVVVSGEEQFAAEATVTSSDGSFTAAGDGGTVLFLTEGGSVTLSVGCGCDWTLENSATDIFTATVSSSSVTVSCGQNTVEDDLLGELNFYTAASHIHFATVTLVQNAYGAPEISVETSEWHVPAKGDLMAEIGVTSSLDWTAECSADWLVLDGGGDILTLTASANEDVETRSADVTLACTDGIRTATARVAVIQDAVAYITLGSESVGFTRMGGELTVSVESNYDWSFSAEGSWFSVSVDGNSVTVTAGENDIEDDRTGSVTFTAGDGAQNTAEAVLTVRQAWNEAMVLTFTVGAGTEIVLPICGDGLDATVDWGDGSGEEITAAHPTHTYASGGVYDVGISGTVTALSYLNIYSSDTLTSYDTNLTGVKAWGTTGLTSMEYAFYACYGLKSIPGDTSASFSGVTTFNHAFRDCRGLEAVPADLFKYTRCTTYERCFMNCASLTAIPEGLFDPVRDCAVDMFFVFGNTLAAGEVSPLSVPDGFFENFTHVTTFARAFQQTNIYKIPDRLFAGCTVCEDFSYCFVNCTGVTAMGADVFKGCSAVTTFERLLNNCQNLTAIPEDLFASCPNVTNFDHVFYFCSGLTTVPEGVFSHCPKVETFSYALSMCLGLSTVPEDLFASCPDVTDFSCLFYVMLAYQSNSKLTSVPAGLFDHNLKVKDFSQTFCGCVNCASESPYAEITVDGQTVKAHLYDRSYYDDVLGCVNPADHTKCFYYASKFSDYSGIPSSWKN